MINLILTGIVLAVPAYMAFMVVHGYAMATGTTWERLVAAFKGSASVFWARLNGLSVGAVGLLGYATDLAGLPGVKETIAPFLAPEYMTAYVLFVLIGAEIARRRTLP